MFDDEVSTQLNIPNLNSIHKPVRGQGVEAQKVINQLGTFDPENCVAKDALYYFFSSGVTHNELKSIATLICLQIPNLKMTRLEQRDSRVLMQWFSNNWEQIFPLLPRIHLRDENKEIINLEREMRFYSINKK